MTLTNDDPLQVDELIEAQTTVAARCELHSHEIDAQGVVRMRPVEAISLPASGEVKLQPSGLHIMLLDLEEPSLQAGDTFDLTLRFRHAGVVSVAVVVKERAASSCSCCHEH